MQAPIDIPDSDSGSESPTKFDGYAGTPEMADFFQHCIQTNAAILPTQVDSAIRGSFRHLYMRGEQHYSEKEQLVEIAASKRNGMIFGANKFLAGQVLATQKTLAENWVNAKKRECELLEVNKALEKKLKKAAKDSKEREGIVADVLQEVETLEK